MGLAKRMMMQDEENRVRGYSLPVRGEKFLCPCHFTNSYLRQFIEQQGDRGTCSYCGHDGCVIDLTDFVEFIGGRLCEYFQDLDSADLPLASGLFESDDEDIPGLRRIGPYMVSKYADYFESSDEAIECFDLEPNSDELYKDLLACLHLEYKIRRDPNSPLMCEELAYSWSQFCDLVKRKQRYTFFHSSLFDEPTVERSPNGLSDILSELGYLVRNVEKVVAKGMFIYRGRPTNMEGSVTCFEDLTSPPAKFAKVNRLSPAGISMFYGSFEPDTPIAEIRNYSDNPFIYLGEFETLKDLHVVDLCDLPKIDFWMPYGWQEFSFLSHFHDEISKPISQDDIPDIEYIPSQIFTEYIKCLCKTSGGNPYDGIVYRSSLTGEKNIVLFYDRDSSAEVLKLVKGPEEIGF